MKKGDKENGAMREGRRDKREGKWKERRERERGWSSHRSFFNRKKLKSAINFGTR